MPSDCVELRAAGNTGPTASPRRAAIERAGARLLAFCTLRSAGLPARTAAAAVLAALATGLFARVGVDVAGIGHARLGISERAREEVGRDEGPIARRLGRRELAVLAERCDRPRVGPRRRPILSRPRDEVDLRRRRARRRCARRNERRRPRRHRRSRRIARARGDCKRGERGDTDRLHVNQIENRGRERRIIAASLRGQRMAQIADGHRAWKHRSKL